MKYSAVTLCLLLISFFNLAQSSQNDEINKLTSDKYTVHKAVKKGSKKYDLEKASKPWPVEFKITNSKCEEILIKRAGIIDEIYKADLPKYPAYYDNSASEIVVTVIDKKIYYYTWSIKTGATISYILTEKSVSNYDSEKAELDEYRRNILENQENAREERIEENNQLAAEELAQNTIKGKNIKSIQLKLVDKPNKVGLLTIVSIGVEVELADGTILSTKNLGGKTPYQDFVFEVSGGDYAGGDFKVANDSREIPNDEIKIVAKSKYDNSAIKGYFNFPLNYKSDIFYQYQGKSGQNGRGRTVGFSVHGGNGSNGKSVNINAELLNINNESVNEITITDAMTGELLAVSKLHVDNQITVNVNGGSGGHGESGSSTHSEDGGNGGDAGDAGDVMLVGSGADVLQITVMNRGGKGGAGGKGKSSYNNSGYNGNSGSDGSFIR